MVGLASDGRLFGLDPQLLFDVFLFIINAILLIILVGSHQLVQV